MIRHIEQEKLSIYDYAEDMRTKADVNEVNSKFETVGTILDTKAAIDDVAVHLGTKADKALV